MMTNASLPYRSVFVGIPLTKTASSRSLEIINRNPKDGECLPQEEHDYYATFPELQVRWQKKAWDNTQVMLDWLVDFRASTLRN
jgi:hypothetical protein